MTLQVYEALQLRNVNLLEGVYSVPPVLSRFRPVIFNSDSSANEFAMATIEDNNYITNGSAKESTLIV